MFGTLAASSGLCESKLSLTSWVLRTGWTEMPSSTWPMTACSRDSSLGFGVALRETRPSGSSDEYHGGAGAG